MQTGLNGQCPNFVHDYCMLSLKNCFFLLFWNLVILCGIIDGAQRARAILEKA